MGKYTIQATKKGVSGSYAITVFGKNLSEAYKVADKKLIKDGLKQQGFKLTSVYNIVGFGSTRVTKISKLLSIRYGV